jgi:hypothetical protein
MESNRVIEMGSSRPSMTVLLELPSCQSGPLTRTAPGNVGAGAEAVDELLRVPDAAELLCFPLLHQTWQILVTKKWLLRLCVLLLSV